MPHKIKNNQSTLQPTIQWNLKHNRVNHFQPDTQIRESLNILRESQPSQTTTIPQIRKQFNYLSIYRLQEAPQNTKQLQTLPTSPERKQTHTKKL
eukprot:gene3128-2110_t